MLEVAHWPHATKTWCYPQNWKYLTEAERAMATGNTNKKIDEDRHCSFRVMQVDRQTDILITILRTPSGKGQSKNYVDKFDICMLSLCSALLSINFTVAATQSKRLYQRVWSDRIGLSKNWHLLVGSGITGNRFSYSQSPIWKCRPILKIISLRVSHRNSVHKCTWSSSMLLQGTLSSKRLIGPILWGHSGPLCHALSLSLSFSWTSMRRRRATVAACDTWWMAM